MGNDNTPLSPIEFVKKLNEQAATLKACGELFEANQAELSKLFHQRYVSLIKAGFDESKAFAIVLHRGLT